MNERDRIIALTRIAFLNAIILSLLSIQFIIPAAFVLLLWIVPAIFALEVCHTSLRLALLSGSIIIACSLSLFGIGIGLWTLVYVCVGGVLGGGQRLHYHWTIRLLSTSLAFTLSLFIVAITFAWLAQVSWSEVKNMLVGLTLLNQLQLMPVMIVGLITWTVILSIAADWFFSRVAYSVIQ